MNRAEQHVLAHAQAFTQQERFRRIAIRFDPENGGAIHIEGYVANHSDFGALREDWLKTNPPCPTNIFVHVDPQRDG